MARSPIISPWTLSPHVADLVVDAERPHAEHGGPVVRYRDESRRRRKVAICGAGGCRSMPWDDASFECWSMNNFWEASRDSAGRIAASRWFEQHQIFPDEIGPHAGQEIQNAQDMAWLRQCPVPLYTTEPFPENPRAVVWPIEYFARKYRDYFTCSFAMQIVQAYDEGFAELHVYGLELLFGTKREATVESSCVNYWLGFVEGRGMKVVVAPLREASTSPLLARPIRAQPQFLLAHPYRYGHEYWLEADWVRDEYLANWDRRPTAI